ncbi:MAG: nuclear transport factor 2 family protein, partial [Mycobacterium sp.]
MDTELREQVNRLTDRAEIYDCMQRYARGIDRRDRALLRSAYHDGAVDDHVGFVGAVDDFIDWALAYHSTQTRHQHYLLNHTVDIDGGVAHAETYYLFVGTDREPANHMTISGGRYV